MQSDSQTQKCKLGSVFRRSAPYIPIHVEASYAAYEDEFRRNRRSRGTFFVPGTMFIAQNTPTLVAWPLYQKPASHGYRGTSTPNQPTAYIGIFGVQKKQQAATKTTRARKISHPHCQMEHETASKRARTGQSYAIPPPDTTRLDTRRRPGACVGGGGCTNVMHDRSRMTIDPRIPVMPGRSTSGFRRPGRQCLQQARNTLRCPTSRMKGELHPALNCL